MPRYYFDVSTNGQVLPDDEGLDLPSPAVARSEPMTAAAEMAKEDGASPKDIVIAVRDDGPEPVGTVRLSLTWDGR